MFIRKTTILALSFVVSQVSANQLPFGFEVGSSSLDIKHQEVTVQSLRNYCPSLSYPLIGKTIKFSDSTGIFDFSYLDFERIRNSAELARFHEVPSAFYRNAKPHLVEYYKESDTYQLDVDLARKFSASPEFQSAFKEIPRTVKLVQKVYDINGDKVCAGFINDSLWTISFTPTSTDKFEAISRDIKKKYNSKGLLSKWHVDCEEFGFKQNQNCVVISNSVDVKPGVSVSYLLKEPNAKGFGIYDKEDRQYDGLQISRENQEMVVYKDWKFERKFWEQSKLQWRKFISRYTRAFKDIYQKEQLKLKNKESEFLDQF